MSKGRRGFHAGIAALAIACLAGCEQHAPPPPSSVSHGIPPLDPNVLAPPSGPLPHAEHAPVDTAGDGTGAPPLPAGHPAMGQTMGQMGSDPHAGAMGGGAEAVTPGDIPFDAKTVVSGVIKLDAKLKDKVKPGDTIFLIARGLPQGGTPGPVLAVQRVEAKTFPMPFQLDSRDAMMVGTQMKPPLEISARVDKDGDAITKNPGDLVGAASLKSLPAKGLTLMLDKEL